MSPERARSEEEAAGPAGLRFGRLEGDRATDLWYEIDVEAAPEAVWQAVTAPEFVREFYFGLHLETDWTAGGPIRYVEPDGAVCMLGVIEHVEIGRSFSVSIRYVADPEAARDAPSHVQWELQDLDGITRVRVEHRGLAKTGRTLEILSGGWPTAVRGIKELVETGRAAGIQSEWPEHRIAALMRLREADA